MKTERNILIAFFLNFTFSILEIIGGALIGSVAIISDAVHDMADAVSIGIAWFLEKKSKRDPDGQYTYGYARYSIIGSLITTVILIVGSVIVGYNAVKRIIAPAPIHYDGMILFAVVGVAMNLLAAFVTREGDSLNQKAVNLHMLEDVLGWVVVLAGAIVMRFTDWQILDPLMSIGVAVFILYHSVGMLIKSMAIFLEKAPNHICLSELKSHIEAVEGVQEVHHIHLWTMDGCRHYATMHIVTEADPQQIKAKVRAELREHGIDHATLELESSDEHCEDKTCTATFAPVAGKHHHHHH